MTTKQPNGDSSGDPHPYRKYWLTAGAGTIIVAVVAVVVVLIQQSSTSSTQPPTPSPSRSAAVAQTSTQTPTAQTAAAQAAFTFPNNFATNIPAACNLTASGTVQHLEKNHHLWLFLYFYDDKYFAGDNLTVVKDGVHWSGRIYIGGNKQPGQQFVLWLLDLGPNGWTELNTNMDGQQNGFHGWRLANDVTRAAYVDFTTGHEKCPS